MGNVVEQHLVKVWKSSTTRLLFWSLFHHKKFVFRKSWNFGQQLHQYSFRNSYFKRRDNPSFMWKIINMKNIEYLNFYITIVLKGWEKFREPIKLRFQSWDLIITSNSSIEICGIQRERRKERERETDLINGSLHSRELEGNSKERSSVTTGRTGRRIVEHREKTKFTSAAAVHYAAIFWRQIPRVFLLYFRACCVRRGDSSQG